MPVETPPESAPYAAPTLTSLIDHDGRVTAETRLDAVYEQFQRIRHDALAVLRGDTFAGIVTRGSVGFLMGSRYGHSVYAAHPAERHVQPECLAFPDDAPIRAVLEAALGRSVERFYDDVAVLDAGGRFLGLSSTRTLVRAQSLMLSRQTCVGETQRTQLAQRNEALAKSLRSLRASQGQYRTLFEHGPLGAALVDAQGQVKTRNRRLVEILGREPPAELASIVAASDRAQFDAVLAGGGAAPQCFEPTVTTPDRGPRTIHVAASRIAETGETCVTVEDVTERRLLDRRAAEQEKSDLLDRLAGGIAHEINNKLAPVHGYAALVAGHVAGAEPVAGWCATIQTCAMEAATIIRQLLQMSKPVQAESRPTDLAAAAEQALLLCRFRAREEGVTVIRAGAGAWGMADPAEVQQVVLNLVLNAIDALAGCARREVEVRVESAPAGASITVRDSGPGVPGAIRGRIFEPFFTTKDPDRGTGLGLPVCRGIARRHGGDVTVCDAPGGGAMFRVTFAGAATAEHEDALTPEDVAPRPPHSRDDAPEPGRVRVLVVDDEEHVAALLRDTLATGLGCVADTARSGAEAVRALSANEYQLVVCDVRMPGIDGPGVLEWIRERRPALAQRFLFVTGDAGTPRLAAHLARLGVPTLPKPFVPRTLLQRCELLLNA